MISIYLASVCLDSNTHDNSRRKVREKLFFVPKYLYLYYFLQYPKIQFWKVRNMVNNRMVYRKLLKLLVAKQLKFGIHFIIT